MGAALACSFRRLHIEPFTRELEDRIIGPALKPQVKDISFHSKPTFPEKGFGFVELPEMEAEKLKRKLNGATLRGQKVKVEDAKPDKKRKSDDEEDEGGGKVKKVRRDKKAREDGVLPGVELEEGRAVKRGWTEDGETRTRGKRKASQSQPADATVEGKKLRFKTTVPPNVATQDDGGSKKKAREDKKSKKVVVQEFSKSKQSLTNLGAADDAEHGELAYEDGKGWVDQAGNVVELERPSKRPSRKKSKKDTEPAISALESTETNEVAPDDGIAVDTEPNESSKQEAESITAPGSQPQATNEVHPLEALFKRPTSSSSNSSRPRPKAIDTSFSFFDANAAEEEDADMDVAMPPKTPNTRRDLEWRSIRSAAPTPDTAAIGRKFSFPFASGNEADEEDESGDDNADVNEDDQAEAGASQTTGQGQGEESAFRKWFYEHRGEFNRGWKKRRREEKKQKRQRENRRLSRRVA